MSDDNDIRHGRHCVFKMHVQTLLERRPVVSVPLRVVLRRRSDLRRAPVHRTAAIAALKPKGGYAARAILPRPERQGLPRTWSKDTSNGVLNPSAFPGPPWSPSVIRPCFP